MRRPMFSRVVLRRHTLRRAAPFPSAPPDAAPLHLAAHGAALRFRFSPHRFSCRASRRVALCALRLARIVQLPTHFAFDMRATPVPRAHFAPPRPVPPRPAPPRPGPPRLATAHPAPSRSHLARAPSHPPLRASPRVSPAWCRAQARAVPRPLPCASSPIHVIPPVVASRLARRFGCLRCVHRAAPRLAPVALPRPTRHYSLCPRRAALIFPSGLAPTSPHPASSLPRPGPTQLHFVVSYRRVPLHPAPSRPAPLRPAPL